MRTRTLILLFIVATFSWPMDSIAQEKEKTEERQGLKIDERLFQNTTLNPELFHSVLRELANDRELLKDVVSQIIGIANYANSDTAYHHEIASVGDGMSFELNQGRFIIRVLTKEEQSQIEKANADLLPDDLKSKQIFTITKVTNDSVSVKRGETRLTIPAHRILFFQQGLAPFFR